MTDDKTSEVGAVPDEAAIAEPSSTVSASGVEPSRIKLLGLAGAWLAGFGALTMTTVPDHQAVPIYLPATLETAAEPTLSTQMPAAEQGVDFIVRFHPVDEVELCLNMFKDDPEGARTVFNDWASDYSTLAGMDLKKTSYAGELILSWSTQTGDYPNRADIIEKQKELQAMDVVKYADPDYTAHPGDTP